MSIKLKDIQLFRPLAFIDGEFTHSSSGETFQVENPATNEVIAEVANCGAADTFDAINAAERAFTSWRRKTPAERSALLCAWCRLLHAHREDLARLLTAEQGKPIEEARGEISYGAAYVRWFAEEAKRIYGDVLPAQSNDARLLTIKQPVGVVACITPWNFPNAMLVRKIAPALAAGCTVVCKPANETPLSAFAIAELAVRAGIPNGVINILAGETEEIGRQLTSSPKVRKLTFTGSTKVGKLLTHQCADTLKRLSMELGGNAPFIVFETADLDAAVDGLVANKFRNAGQTCVCTNRVFVQESVVEPFTEKLSLALGKLKVGNGAVAGTKIGPLINEGAVRKVESLIEDAVSKGGWEIDAGAEKFSSKNFMSPKIIANANRSMRVFEEEIFGPVAPIFSFQTEEQAIELANDTPFGLAGYFYSRDLSQIWRVGERIETGMVGVNTAAISSEVIPFGGVKESGQGREGSKYGLDDYLEIKHLKIGGLSL